MREPKYRAWDKQQRKMYFVSKLDLSQKKARLAIDRVAGFDEIELMEFTGLVDKNGTDIYEGDILRVDWGDKRYPVHNGGPVEWDIHNACWRLGEGGSPESDARQSMEVISSIYEHPELLKEHIDHE